MPSSAPAREPGGAVLVPGSNVWRIARARRVACLVDGAAYYRRLHQALQRARRSVFVLGWEFDSRVELLRSDEPGDAPTRFGDLLNHLAESRPDLHVYVLAWDFATLYALERQPFLGYRLGWRTHARVHFQFDDHHPLGASHHQKLVVIDDRVAFSGGLDLTAHRWDTPAHAPDDARRHAPDGTPFRPFHDVQMAVEGPAATALGALARARWRVASRIDPVEPEAPLDGAGDAEAWPADLEADLEDVPVAIARTQVPEDGDDAQAVREVEASLLDSIRAARRSLYVENQYFTAAAVVEALAGRLAEPDGPELVLVLPRSCTGWLEERTMGALRERALAALKEADTHGRLRVLHPVVSRARDAAVFVHAKVLVVDETLLRVGSANLSNRSMGLDTECDLVVRAEHEAHEAGVARVRARLLGEHLGVEPGRVEAEHRRTGSLRATVDALAGGDRTLAPLEVDEEASANARTLAPESLFDPERPIEVGRLVRDLLSRLDDDAPEDAHPRRGTATVAVLLLALVVSLGLAWRFTALGEALSVESLRAGLDRVAQVPGAPLLILGLFAMAGLVAFPLNALVLATVLVFGSLGGGALAYGGALTSALVNFAVGRAVGREPIRRLAGRRLNELSERLRAHGVLAVALLRLVPLAPAALVNLACGAAGLRARDFALGSALGFLPGIVGVVVVGRQLARWIEDPGWQTGGWLAATAVFVVGLLLWTKRVLERRAAGGPARGPAKGEDG